MVDELSRIFGALADPTRRSILQRLLVSDATVSELAEPFDMTFAAVSKHLKVLENAGLVTKRQRSQFRSAHLDAKPLAAASRWINSYARLWEESLDSLDGYLNAMQQLSDSVDKKHQHK